MSGLLVGASNKINKQGGRATHYGLAIYIKKSILRQKKELWKFKKNSSCKKKL
jgi:hypothetical protein